MPTLTKELEKVADITELETNPVRDFDRETKRPKLDSTVTAVAIRDKTDEPDYKRKAEHKVETIDFDAVFAYLRNSLHESPDIPVSSQVPTKCIL